MAVRIGKTKTKMSVKSYPRCILILCATFLVIFLLAAINTHNNLKVIDYVIFVSVILVVVMIQPHRVLTLDKEINQGSLLSRRLITKQEVNFKLNQIDSVEMVYGKGSQNARGGAVYMKINGQNKAIIDSDICIGNRQHNDKIRTEILLWLGQ
jgi:hypothetical protein